MKFVILGLLIVLFIGYLVVVWKAAQNWRWYHLVVVIITMLLAILLLFPTAGVLKSRAAWHQVKEKLEKQAAEVEVEQHLIKHGDPTNMAVPEGLTSLAQKLSKLGIEAGRRWRNLKLQNVDKQVTKITLGVPAEPEIDAGDQPPAAGEAVPPTQPLVPTGLVVYGFAETPNQELQILIPTFYLGEFRVTESTPTQTTLVPTGPLEPAQMQAISGRKASSWSVYELLPLDAHLPFVAEGSVPSEDNYFGRVDEALVKSLLGKSDSPEAARTLQNYLRDGNRATQNDPPLSRWTKIEFTKKYSVEVDSPEQRGALDGGFFDGNGRAVDGRLQRGGDDGQVRFEKGDQILVKEEFGDQVVDEGAAKLIDRYYLRPMNDYRFILRHIRLRLSELDNRKAELEFAKQLLEEAIDKSNGMLVANQDTKIKLEQDLKQFQMEKAAIEEYTTKLRQQVEQTRLEMSRLYRQNVELAQRLDQIHRTIEQRVDALTMVP